MQVSDFLRSCKKAKFKNSEVTKEAWGVRTGHGDTARLGGAVGFVLVELLTNQHLAHQRQFLHVVPLRLCTQTRTHHMSVGASRSMRAHVPLSVYAAPVRVLVIVIVHAECAFAYYMIIISPQLLIHWLRLYACVCC